MIAHTSQSVALLHSYILSSALLSVHSIMSSVTQPYLSHYQLLDSLCPIPPTSHRFQTSSRSPNIGKSSSRSSSNCCTRGRIVALVPMWLLGLEVVGVSVASDRMGGVRGRWLEFAFRFQEVCSYLSPGKLEERRNRARCREEER